MSALGVSQACRALVERCSDAQALSYSPTTALVDGLVVVVVRHIFVAFLMDL